MSDHYRKDPSPRRLYRDKEHGMICGVCAGIAEYLGAERSVVRIIALVSLFVFMPATMLAYLALCLLLPVRPPALYKDDRDEAFWRGVRTSPQGTFSSMRHRFREMEMRLQRMERYVTSSRFHLDKEFRDLQD